MKKIILIKGPLCSGKSTISEILQKRIKNSSYIDEDVIKVNIEPNKTSQWRSKLAFITCLFLVERLMQRKRTIIIDLHSSKKDRYSHYKKLAKKYGYQVYSFHLIPPLEECIQRNKKRPIPKANYKISIEEVKKHYEKIQVIRGEKIFDTSKISPEDLVNQILKEIK